MRGIKRDRKHVWRIPAGDLEVLVVARLRGFFTDPSALLDVADAEAHGGSGRRQLIERGRQVAEELGADTPDKAKAKLMALMCRITIHCDRIEIALSRFCTAALLAGTPLELAAQPQNSVPAPHVLMTLRAPARLRRAGREMRMTVEGADSQSVADPSLLRIIARAHAIQTRLSQDTDLTGC